MKNLPFVAFDLFDFLKICGFLMKAQARQDALTARYVEEMKYLSLRPWLISL